MISDNDESVLRTALRTVAAGPERVRPNLARGDALAALLGLAKGLDRYDPDPEIEREYRLCGFESPRQKPNFARAHSLAKQAVEDIIARWLRECDDPIDRRVLSRIATERGLL